MNAKNHRGFIASIAWIVLVLLPLAALAESTSEVASEDISIKVAGDRTLPLHVVYPIEGSGLPVIVLSHGTFSAGTKYEPVARHWAAAGYAVVLPDHRDANYGETPKSDTHMMEIIDSRTVDLVEIADQLAEIEKQIPALQKRLDVSQLVSAGHSVGTQGALQMTGLRFRNPNTGEVRGVDESRYIATVLLSDPGKMALMPEDLWLGGSRPVFLVTGPEDYGLMGDGRRPTDYENEILEPAVAVEEGDRYLLSIDGMDHQFGGLIHKGTGTEPDHDAMQVFLELSTAFLDVYVRGDRARAELLEPHRISERAELSVY